MRRDGGDVGGEAKWKNSKATSGGCGRVAGAIDDSGKGRRAHTAPAGYCLNGSGPALTGWWSVAASCVV